MKDSIQDVLSFWFKESSPSQWVQVSDVFDAMVRDRFSGLYRMASSGVCDGWCADVEGCLALVLIFDQFPRNMFRGTPQAFETDDRARQIARQTVSLGFDHLVSVPKRRFFYLPFEHSENPEDQKLNVALSEKMKDDDPLGYDRALRILSVIERFGRFPHRNAILGRSSTPDEISFLGGSSGGSRV